MLQTLHRAGRVLELFSAEQSEWGATAVARELGIAKSQAHELLVSLCEIGLVQRTRAGRYRLGWRIVTLSSVVWDTSEFPREAVGAMRQLGGRYGETVQLAVWGGDRAVCIAGWLGSRALAVTPQPVGTAVPAHSTGLGKVLLAGRPRKEIEDVLARRGAEDGLGRTRAQLEAELAGVRRRGFAYEQREFAPETCSVAAPIIDAGDEVLAALAMAVPADRWPARRDEYTRALVAATGQISALLSRPGALRAVRSQ